jgi:hypothetical protein
MAEQTSDLMVGELIEIKYRLSRLVIDGGSTHDFVDRWVTAQIVHNDNDAPPVARLVDGQITDIRAYMTWRRLPGIGRVNTPAA